MAEHTPEAVAEALEYYRVTTSGRTRYEGQAAYYDEVLVAEIERLTALLALIREPGNG